MFVKELSKMGLTEPEAKIYSSLVRLGEASAVLLSRRTELGRTNVYDYTDSLIKKGLVYKYERDGRTYFTAEDPQRLQEIVNEKIRETKVLTQNAIEIIPKLNDFFNKSMNKPQVNYVAGKTGYEEMLSKIYQEFEGREIYILVRNLDDYSIPEPRFRNQFIKKNIFTNLICNKASSLYEFTKRDVKENRKTIELSKADIVTDLIIWDDQILFGNIYSREFHATYLRSKELAEILSNLIKSMIS